MVFFSCFDLILFFAFISFIGFSLAYSLSECFHFKNFSFKFASFNFQSSKFTRNGTLSSFKSFISRHF